MENSIHFTLKPDTIENLRAYAQMLDKEISTVIEEALDTYFTQIEKQRVEKNMADESAMTTLDYEEFWEGIDL